MLRCNSFTNPPQSTPGHKPGSSQAHQPAIATAALLPEVLRWLRGPRAILQRRKTSNTHAAPCLRHKQCLHPLNRAPFRLELAGQGGNVIRSQSAAATESRQLVGRNAVDKTPFGHLHPPRLDKLDGAARGRNATDLHARASPINPMRRPAGSGCSTEQPQR